MITLSTILAFSAHAATDVTSRSPQDTTMSMLKAWTRGDDLAPYFTPDCVIDASRHHGLIASTDGFRVYDGHDGLRSYTEFLSTLMVEDFTSHLTSSTENVTYVTNSYKMSLNGHSTGYLEDTLIATVKSGEIAKMKILFGSPRAIEAIFKRSAEDLGYHQNDKYSILSPISYPSYPQQAKFRAIDSVKAAGLPVLSVFKMRAWTPKLIKTWLKVFGAMTAPNSLNHIGPVERDVIHAAVSSTNNCELCLSFHASALKGKLSDADVSAMLDGGLPKDDPTMRKWAIAAKYALAHKGVILPREREHLRQLGLGPEEMLEVIFVAGQTASNNMMFVHLIQEGATAESFLQKAGPFADTVYKADA